MKVGVRMHKWLDGSWGYFVMVNSITAGGELYSIEAAWDNAAALAKELGVELTEGREKSTEFYECIRDQERL